MTIEAGKQLSQYRLIEQIGEGGMGVVWKAVDTTLDREVAIKVLPAGVIDDPDRLGRFEREAKLLASLNHPNIASIFGIHEADPSGGSEQGGVHFLAMELIPGQDLSQSLQEGPLPLDQALRIAREIATGLEAAHENGVIHRDLKPANVKLTQDGKAKVLDFGLAKVADATAASGDPSQSPTLTSAGTVAGMILGTASYMSPEQAAAQPIDRRCDIWSFGVLLHELLTGKRMFEGETISHTLAAVLRAEIDLEDLPKETPRAVQSLLKRCLERDPARRLRDIGEARILLDDVQSGRVDETEPTPATAEAHVAGKGRFGYLAIAILALAAVALMAFWPKATPPPPPYVQSTLMPPPGWDFAPGSPFAVSRDGRRIAFVAVPRQDNKEAAGESSSVWVRDLARAEARRVADSDGSAFPFWSPDGRWIAFFSGRKLNKVEADGGPVIPICDATEGRGGSWNETGTIVFQRNWSEGLMQVSAAGGTPEPLTTLNKDRFDMAHRWPHFLPDGRRFLFYVVSTSNPVNSEHSGIYVGSLDSDEVQFLQRSESRGVYARGHLIYRSGSTLMARPLELEDLEFTGDPTPVATDVPGGAISWGGAQFGVSDADVLIHLRGIQASLSVLTWRDREGKVLRTLGEADGYWEPAFSHDRKRLAFALGKDTIDIWIQDLERDTRTRFTFDAAQERTPVWSPDDKLLAYNSSSSATGEIWVRPTTGQGEAELLYTANTNIRISDWSVGGQILFNYQEPSDDSWDVWTLDPETRQAKPLLAGPFEQQAARISPDGKWLAFESDESGRAEIYVQKYPEADGRWMVSSDSGARGAFKPVWSDDGTELFYYRSGRIFAVSIAPGDSASFGTPKPLFAVNPKSGQGSAMDIAYEGQRILINELPPVDPAKSGARLMQNWSVVLESRNAR